MKANCASTIANCSALRMAAYAAAPRRRAGRRRDRHHQCRRQRLLVVVARASLSVVFYDLAGSMSGRRRWLAVHRHALNEDLPNCSRTEGSTTT